MAEEHPKGNSQCSSELHSQHLCYIISQGFHISDEQGYKALVEAPQYKCTHCGRVAKSDQNLCKPVKL